MEQGRFLVRTHGNQSLASRATTDFGVHIGAASAPSNKDQDRYSMQYFRSKEIAMEDEGANQSAPPMMGFGLFDGHGFSSGVADLCEESLLLDIGKELEILRAVNPNSGDEPSLTEDDCIREAFRKLQAQADARFSGERVGSTATVVLATPSVSHEEVRHLRTPIRSRRRLSSDLERTPEKAQLSRNATSLGAAQSPGVIASPSSFEGVSKSLFLGSDLSASAGAPSLDDSSSSTSPRSIAAVPLPRALRVPVTYS